jgi:hypothetical protein
MISDATQKPVLKDTCGDITEEDDDDLDQKDWGRPTRYSRRSPCRTNPFWRLGTQGAVFRFLV